MEITRNGKTFTLTSSEVLDAWQEKETAFMLADLKDRLRSLDDASFDSESLSPEEKETLLGRALPICEKMWGNSKERSDLYWQVREDALIAAWKLIQEERFQIAEITLLSVDEYQVAKHCIPPMNDWWWLRSPGCNSKYAAYVNIDGWILTNGHRVGITIGAVRPALRILNLQSLGLKIGDQIDYLAGHSWTVVADDLALCNDGVGQSVFRRNGKAADANVYEKSDVKRYLQKWAETAGIVFVKEEAHEKKEQVDGTISNTCHKMSMFSLSTAHLTKETADWLWENTDVPIPAYAKTLSDGDIPGYFVCVTGWDDDEETVRALPEDLKAILRIAKQDGYDWIVLDRDEVPYSGLPTYDWGGKR